MSDVIEIESSRLHLTIQGVPGVIEAGRSAQFTLTLFNTGDELDEARLQVEGLDPAWVRFTPAANIAVFPGEATSAVVTIEVPLAAAPGYYAYTLRAESREEPGEALQQVLQLSVIPAVIPQGAVGAVDRPEVQPVAGAPEPERAAPVAMPPAPEPLAPAEVPAVPIQPQEPAPPKLVMPRAVMPLETPPPPEAPSAPRAGEPGGPTVVVPAVPVPPQEPPKLVMPRSVMPLETPPPPDTPAPDRVPLSAPRSPVPPPRSQDALLKSTKIGLQFDRTQLALGPGETAAVAITVTNLGRIVDTVQLEIYGLPAGWSSVAPVTVTLQPGEAGQTTLTLSPPAQATARATTFFVRARSWVEAVEITEAALTLAVRAQVRFSLKLEPPQASGERQAAYELRVANEGNAPLALALAGKDDARSCSYVFQPAVLTVAPQSEGKARVVVQAAGPLPGNQPQPVFFTLGVTPEGQPELAQQIAGQFMRLPAPPATMDLRPRAFTDPRQGVYALRVNNPGAAEVTYALSASDPDNACLYMFDPALAHAPAGQGVDVRLTVRARELNVASAAREVQFTIAANPVGGGAALAPLAGKFVQPANPNLALSLNPPQTSAAGPAQYVLTVQNPKPVPVTVTLQALDAADACACVFNPNTLALAPNTQGQAQLAVTPKDRMLPGEQRRVHVFTVTAAASSGERAQIEGRLAQVPGEESRAVSRETRRAGGCLLWLPVVLVLLVLGLAGLDVGCHLGDGAPPSGACQALGVFDPVSAPIAGLLKGGPQATAIVEVTPAPTAGPTQAPTAVPATPPPATRVPTAAPRPTAVPADTPTPAPTVGPTPEMPPYDNRTSPVDLLASYYNAISLKDYARAYGYWGSGAPNTYDEFVRNYADTASVLLAVRLPVTSEGAAGSSYATVPGLVIATHTDGSLHASTACYVTRMTNSDPEAGWRLYKDSVAPSPRNSVDGALLERACDELDPGAGSTGRPYESTDTPLDVIASYYNAISLKDYERAFSYWKEAPNPSYDDFVRGFSDTAAVLLAVRPPAWIGAAAGTAYAETATLLIATHTDGSLHVFAGCFVTTKSTVMRGAGWLLDSAKFAATAGNSGDVTVLNEVCPRH